MSLEWPDDWERHAIAENEFRHYTRDDLFEWAVRERAADFEAWPTILDAHLEWLAEQEGIGYEDATAHAIFTPEGVTEMKAWARAHAFTGEADETSPAAVVGTIERHYPGGVEGWRRRPRAKEPAPLLRQLLCAVRRFPLARHRDS